VLENVDFLENSEDQVKLVNLFGEEKTIRAKVKTLSLVDHKIVLEPL
ncbi:MAG: CooT family nickel-binding protein, partial [Deltaproteobacteria bacterium]|nr:CooT family nickel-binding protein [Deltaproteobacteria bacterium]